MYHIHVQSVHHDQRVYSQHVFVAPSEHIPVIFEKSCQCLVDRRAGEGTNPCCLIISRAVEKYLFKLFNGLCPRLVFLYVHSLEVIVHLHHSYIAFTCSYLISAQLPYSILCRELDH